MQIFAGGLAFFLAGDRQGAKRGDLDDIPAETDMRQTETAPDQVATAEQFLYFFRPGIGGDVEILRFPPQQHVAHAAADQIGLIAGLLQAVQHLQGAIADICARDGVLSAGYDSGRAYGFPAFSVATRMK